MIFRYIAGLSTSRIVLWCYLVWYAVIASRYFDPSPAIWLNAVGISAVIGTALWLGLRHPKAGALDFWQVFRLYLTPFCVASFSALIKGRGFLLVFPPSMPALALAAGACGVFVAVVVLVKGIASRGAGQEGADAGRPRRRSAKRDGGVSIWRLFVRRGPEAASTQESAMRFIITAQAGAEPADPEAGGGLDAALLTAYMQFNEEMHKAGVLVASEGLNPAARGARIAVRNGRRYVVDGPFAESKELVGGFYIVEVGSLEEAIAWALRAPAGLGSDDILEVRQLTGAGDVPPKVLAIIQEAAPTWSASVWQARG